MRSILSSWPISTGQATISLTKCCKFSVKLFLKDKLIQTFYLGQDLSPSLQKNALLGFKMLKRNNFCRVLKGNHLQVFYQVCNHLVILEVDISRQIPFIREIPISKNLSEAPRIKPLLTFSIIIRVMNKVMKK